MRRVCLSVPVHRAAAFILVRPAPISTAKRAMECDTSADDEFQTITEGSATILFPKTNEVFYNPVQQFNRDMSVAAIRAWSEIRREELEEKWRKKRQKNGKFDEERVCRTIQILDDASVTDPEKEDGPSAREGFKHEGFTILEALAASGLRSIRYAKEIPNLQAITVNDIDPDAMTSIQRNIRHNGLSEDTVKPNLGDACSVMHAHREGRRFDVIDLDPYGSASPFIDAATQAVADGGWPTELWSFLVEDRSQPMLPMQVCFASPAPTSLCLLEAITLKHGTVHMRAVMGNQCGVRRDAPFPASANTGACL